MTQPYQMLTASIRYKCTMSFWIPSLKEFPDVLLKNRELYTDFALLDPQYFNDLKCNGVQYLQAHSMP